MKVLLPQRKVVSLLEEIEFLIVCIISNQIVSLKNSQQLAALRTSASPAEFYQQLSKQCNFQRTAFGDTATNTIQAIVQRKQCFLI